MSVAGCTAAPAVAERLEGLLLPTSLRIVWYDVTLAPKPCG